jgi:hypothetical protein
MKPSILNHKLVETVLFLLESNLHFKVSVPLPEAAEILRLVPKYNEIPSNLSRLVEKIQLAIGPIDFGAANPNTGSYHNIRFCIGNEYSLAIYVSSPKAYRPLDNHAVTASLLQTIGKKFGADEVTVDHSGASIEARFWWD